MPSAKRWVCRGVRIFACGTHFTDGWISLTIRRQRDSIGIEVALIPVWSCSFALSLGPPSILDLDLNICLQIGFLCASTYIKVSLMFIAWAYRVHVQVSSCAAPFPEELSVQCLSTTERSQGSIYQKEYCVTYSFTLWVPDRLIHAKDQASRLGRAANGIELH